MTEEYVKIDIAAAEQVSESVQNVIKRVSAVSEEISVIFRSAYEFWQGEGAEYTCEYGLSCSDSVKKAADALEIRANSLKSALAVYQGSEKDVISVSDELKGGLLH